ncbi:unnamed protein product, partial [marine sediment metagenome]
MPTYSTYQDLSELLDDISLTYSWTFGDIEFFGTGLNDMNIDSEQLETSETDTIHHVVKVDSLDPAYDIVRYSINDGVTFPRIAVMQAPPNYTRVGFNIQLTWDASTGHTIGDYWKFTTTPLAQTAIREFAYDWVNDNLERTHYEIPIPSPSKTVVLAEATYALYLYLRAKNDPRSAEFHQEAIRLITLLTTFKVAAGVPEEAGAEIRSEKRAAALLEDERAYAERMAAEERARVALA